MLSRAGWCLATLSPSRAPWNLGFPLVSWRRARSSQDSATTSQIFTGARAIIPGRPWNRACQSSIADGPDACRRPCQRPGLGWRECARQARNVVDRGLAGLRLAWGIGSLIWRGMTPSPIPPAMPSDSESMFVELLAPPTPRAERSAPRGESGQVAAPARVPWRRRRRRCREHSPSAPSHRVRSRCPRRRTLKNMQTDTQPAAARPRVQSEPRAGKPADAPSAGASAPASRDFGWQPSDSAAPGERARARTRAQARAQGAGRTHRAVARDGEGRASALPRCACVQLALPFLWLIRSRTAAAVVIAAGAAGHV